MKIVIGIILIVLVLAGIAFFLLYVLNARDLTYCGDIKSEDGSKCYVTRVYTADLNADETLSQIVAAMNDNENGSLTAEEMTTILATYQNVIYAPVFMLNLEQEDNRTFVLSGSVYNGLDGEGLPTDPDFRYKNLTLTAGVGNGKVLAAQNVYSEEVNENGQFDFRARNNVVDPVLLDENAGAAFAFTNCDSFRLVFTGSTEAPTTIKLAFTYDVVAQNPLNFTSINGGAVGLQITEAYDDAGRLKPEISLEKVYTVKNEE